MSGREDLDDLSAEELAARLARPGAFPIPRLDRRANRPNRPPLGREQPITQGLLPEIRAALLPEIELFGGVRLVVDPRLPRDEIRFVVGGCVAAIIRVTAAATLAEPDGAWPGPG